ncbi:MAG: hypothetical protein ACOX4O_11075 [Eubacteriales bacterium]|jgi:hypothetical protein
MKKTLISLILLLSAILSACGAGAAGANPPEPMQTADQNLPIEAPDVTLPVGGDMKESPLPPAGISANCIHSRIAFDSFHYFDGELIKLVGNDKFDEWINADIPFEGYTAEECPLSHNIYRFIKHFDISREDFERIYYETGSYVNLDYNIDLLYGDDPAAVYEYYSGTGNAYVMRCRSSDYQIKSSIYDIADPDRSIREERGCSAYSKYSIPQLIYDFGISREDFENIINERVGFILSEIDFLPKEVDENGEIIDTVAPSYEIWLKSFEYDIDRIYREAEEVKARIASGVSAYQIDAELHL